VPAIGIRRASSRASDGAALAKKGGARCGAAPARLKHGAGALSLQRCPMHYPVSSKLFVKSACSKRTALFKAHHGASSIFAHAFQASQLASNSASSQNHRK